jgi:hypothetical protein
MSIPIGLRPSFTEGEFILLGIERDRETEALGALLPKAKVGDLTYTNAAFIALRSEVRQQ